MRICSAMTLHLLPRARRGRGRRGPCGGCTDHGAGGCGFSAGSLGAQILEDLQAFASTGRVLMVAAHPDDENTQLITYLAQGGIMRWRICR